jgi:predicted ferric reductase
MSAHAIVAQAAASATGSQGLWLVSRASGVVLLLLFTAVVVLGVSSRTGATPKRWPRFTIAELHRTLSLFAVALLGLHVATALLDPYVSIGWVASVLPFTSPYERLAIGLGTLAVDIAGAVLITSLLRVRLGLRAWRAVHYLAYLAWPVAFLHAITAARYDQHLGWVVASEWGSLAAVATAVLVRLRRRFRPGPVAGATR